MAIEHTVDVSQEHSEESPEISLRNNVAWRLSMTVEELSDVSDADIAMIAAHISQTPQA